MTTVIYLCLAATLCAQSVPETYEDVAYDQYERTVLEDGSGDIDAVSVKSPLAGDEPAQFFRLIVSQAP